MPPLSAFTRYTSSFVGTMLLTSFAVQNLFHKRTSTAERDRLEAHRTILESLVGRLKAGENMSENEIGRLVRLARGVEGGGKGMADTPWKDVVFGKRASKEDENAALEGARREWDAAVAQDQVRPTMAQPAPPTPGAIPVVPTPSMLSKKPTFL